MSATAATQGPVAGNAAAKAPPFRLPGEHFAAALAFLLAGAAGAVALAPELAAGAYPSTRVVAVTHLFTLGWITTSIMGALYQFLPVALDEPIRWVRVAHVTFVLYVTGLALFVTGLATGRTAVMFPGAVTFVTGLLLFLANLTATLKRASRRDVTWWALTGAAASLFFTVVLGLALAGNLRWGFLGGGRFLALGVHIHLALGGWVLLVMVGVAQRLLPMFLLSHGVSDRLARWAVALLWAGAAALTLFHHGPPWLSRWLPASLLAGGLLAFLGQAAGFYRHRHRRVLDPGMRLAALGLGVLALALPLAVPVVDGGASPPTATAYVALLVLGMSLFVAAHYYKIVPFLIWFHRFGPLAGRQPLPRVADLFSARAATAAGWLLVAGAVGLAGAILMGSPWGARGAAALLAAGVAVESIQMLQLAFRRPA